MKKKIERRVFSLGENSTQRMVLYTIGMGAAYDVTEELNEVVNVASFNLIVT
jgi:hypothetical protein